MDVDYSDETRTSLYSMSEAGAVITLTRDGAQTTARCRLLIDASGPRGFLHRALELRETAFPTLPGTQALFSHFTGVHRTADMPEYETDGQRPYPQDDAALHHVFDDGWMWVLRFGNGVTSAGISITEGAAAPLCFPEGAAAWTRFLARYPTIAAQFGDAEPLREYTATPRLAYRTDVAAGDGWAMLPSAAAFVDPLFSTGLPLTLLGIERLGRILATSWKQPEMAGELRAYGDVTLSDADWTAEFVSGCFAAMPNFALFSHYSMYYFAAASFSEMARRVGRSDLSARFLLQHNPGFAAGLRSGADRLRRPTGTVTSAAIQQLAEEVAIAVEDVNIAGLCDPAKRNWYGIDWSDVIDNARRLGYTPDGMRCLLARADWASYTPGAS